MTTTPQIERMAEALRPWANKSSPNASQHIIEQAAQAAYDASDARFVPMLVTALKAISPKYNSPMECLQPELKCAVYEKIAQQALAQLPEEYR